MAEARYYHKCPVCGRRRLCRGIYGSKKRETNHEIKCTAQCRGRRLAVKAEQDNNWKHYVCCR